MEKIRFETNIPVTVALKFAEGKEAPSQFGDGLQYLYSTTDGRVFYATPALNDRIQALGTKELTITKRQEGNRSVWIVERPGCIPAALKESRPASASEPDGPACSNSHQSIAYLPKIAMDRAVRMFLILAGQAKIEAEQILGIPVDQTIQALACTMFIESAKTGHLDWISAETAQAHVAGQKIRDLEQLEQLEHSSLERKPANLETSAKYPDPRDAWRTRGEMKAVFARLREDRGEVGYFERLKEFGVTDPTQFKSPAEARRCYELLVGDVEQDRRAA